MRWFARFVPLVVLTLSFGCGDSSSRSAVDCRIEGNACAGDFLCQLNADDEYECLPSNQGGAAGEGGSAGAGGDEAGAGGQGGDSGNEGGAAGQGGAAGANEAGAAGQGGAAGSGGVPVDQSVALDFVPIVGGTYVMGFDEEREDRRLTVTVPSFEMMRAEVMVSQYKVCVEADVCRAPTSEASAYQMGLNDHPVNGVTWEDAKAFADFVGARLPSEAEWEYAARSGGQEITYPWGNDEPDCDRVNYAYDGAFDSCVGTTTPVCSYPMGNTAQGLCDMVGNLKEWLADDCGDDETGRPTDGSARTVNPATGSRSIRGGSYGTSRANSRLSKRRCSPWFYRNFGYGFRLARDAEVQPEQP